MLGYYWHRVHFEAFSHTFVLIVATWHAWEYIHMYLRFYEQHPMCFKSGGVPLAVTVCFRYADRVRSVCCEWRCLYSWMCLLHVLSREWILPKGAHWILQYHSMIILNTPDSKWQKTHTKIAFELTLLLWDPQNTFLKPWGRNVDLIRPLACLWCGLQFGMFIFVTIALSLILSLTFFPALLATVGPEGEAGNLGFVFANLKRKLSEDCFAQVPQESKNAYADESTPEVWFFLTWSVWSKVRWYTLGTEIDGIQLHSFSLLTRLLSAHYLL